MALFFMGLGMVGVFQDKRELILANPVGCAVMWIFLGMKDMDARLKALEVRPVEHPSKPD